MTAHDSPLARTGAQDSIARGEVLPPRNVDSIAHAFADIRRRHASRIAILDGERQIDYATLDRWSDALAATLTDAGTSCGDRIGIFMDRSAEAVVAMLAILKCGAACVPFDPAAPENRLSVQSRIAALHGLIVAGGTHTPAWFDGLLFRVDMDCGEHSAHTEKALPTISPDEAAYVIHTSGSTGEPKGVCITHRGVLDLIRGAHFAPVTPDDVVHHGMSIAFDGAIYDIWTGLLNGAAVSILPGGASVSAMCDLVERNAVTTMLITTGLFNTLTDEALRRLARVRSVVVGGDVLAPGAAARFLGFGGQSLINGYGPTEITVFSHVHVLHADDCTVLNGTIPIGTPLPNTTAYVLDSQRRPVAIGEEGELYIGGSGVALGYLEKPALTAERFLPDPFAGGEARMYRSGDLVRQRADGTLEFISRIDTQVKINGFRVELGDIEHTLCATGHLVAACVTHAKNDAGVSQLRAFAVRGDGTTGDPETLLAQLRDLLPAYMMPRSLRFLERLPLTINGKVDRRALLALPDTDVMPASLETDALDADQQALLTLLAGCLGTATLHASDNYFDVGGDSLTAMRFCSLLEQSHGVELPMTALFEADTLGDVLARIAELSHSA